MLKAFRFRLKKLLDMRRQEENQSATRVRQTTARLREVEARIESARRDHAEVYRELAVTLNTGPLPPEAPVQAATHASRLERQIREAERERADAEQQARQAEQEFKRRRTARRAIEELESRDLGAWKDEARRDENASQDEVASQRHERSR